MQEHRMPSPGRSTGFAMIDALVALLLFAVGLLAACAALAHGMRATHAAVLDGRAVDLAADLAEDRRGLTADEAAAALLAWQVRVDLALPAPARDLAFGLVSGFDAAAPESAP
jgi:Tfp pilus assembly protein PilV